MNLAKKKKNSCHDLIPTLVSYSPISFLMYWFEDLPQYFPFRNAHIYVMLVYKNGHSDTFWPKPSVKHGVSAI